MNLGWLAPDTFLQYVAFVGSGTLGFFATVALSPRARRWLGITDDEIPHVGPANPTRGERRTVPPLLAAPRRGRSCTFARHHRRLRHRTWAERLARWFTGGSPRLR